MICSKCKMELKDDAKFCPNCGTVVVTAESKAETDVPLQGSTAAPQKELGNTSPKAVKQATVKKPNDGSKSWIKKPSSWIILVLAIVCAVLLFDKFLNKDSIDKADNNDVQIIANDADAQDDSDDNDTKSNAKTTYTLGDTFEVKDDYEYFEVALGKDLKFTKVDNQFDDNHGKPAIGIPITIKNLGSETQSLDSPTCYGSKGTELDSIVYYFDDSIDKAGKLRSGALHENKYLYFLYDGDGEYAIEFGYGEGKVTVQFDVKK